MVVQESGTVPAPARRHPNPLCGRQPKNSGVFPPKRMVKIMENPIEIHDLGAHPYFGVDTRIMEFDKSTANKLNRLASSRFLNYQRTYRLFQNHPIDIQNTCSGGV